MYHEDSHVVCCRQHFCNLKYFYFLDTEEKDVDDWDIDMSAYYDSEAGDRDAREFIKMHRETRLRQGIDNGDEQTSTAKIGAFEKFSKVTRSLIISLK